LFSCASGSLDVRERIGLGQLRAPMIERYLQQRRAAGYVECRSLRALWPLPDFLAPLGVLPVEEPDPPGPGGGVARPQPGLSAA